MSKGTTTSSFGSSNRENHDSTKFYGSKLYSNLEIDVIKNVNENKIDPKYLNKIICADARDLSILPDDSVHLIITSPPYNASKEYDDDLTLQEYLDLIREVMIESFRVLIVGGRLCLNIANLGRKPYLPLNSHMNLILIEIGFLMRGEIIWNKSASSGVSTAWGSWQSASNPTLRDVHEYIMVYSKKQFGRKFSKGDKIDTVTKEDFLDLTKSIWNFSTVSAKKIGHPAPFPEELPRRCIELFSFKGDIVLDPFVGSGTTAIAAIKSGRKFLGIDIDPEYCELATKRIQAIIGQK